MPTPLPFDISPEAEAYLARRATIPGKEAGISLALRFTFFSREQQMTDTYEGPHFSVAWHEPGIWSGVQAEIGGRNFWIAPEAIDALRGKTLTLIHRYEGERQPGRIRDLLVAGYTTRFHPL